MKKTIMYKKKLLLSIILTADTPWDCLMRFMVKTVPQVLELPTDLKERQVLEVIDV